MTVEEVFKHFGSGRKTCIAIGIMIQNATHWRRKGYVPLSAQIKLEKASGGVLKANIYDCRDTSKSKKKKRVKKAVKKES